MNDRLQHASELVRQGRDNEALAALSSLWEQNEERPALASALEPLVQRFDPARDHFRLLRDAAGVHLDDRDAFSDWVTLNLLLGEDQRVVQWLGQASEPATFALGAHRNPQLLELLERHSEWAILGRLLKNPAELLKGEFEHVERTLAQKPEWFSEEDALKVTATLQEMLRKRAGSYFRALTAANRLFDAHSFASEARKLDSCPEMDEELKPRAHR